MKKPHDLHNRDAHSPAAAALRVVNVPTFDVVALEQLEFPKTALKALFDVVVAGVVIKRCRLLVNPNGQAWMAGPTTPDRYSPGGYRCHVAFDPDLAAAVLEVVLARLAADEEASVA